MTEGRKLSPRTVERRTAVRALTEAEDRLERLTAKVQKLDAARQKAATEYEDAARLAEAAAAGVDNARAEVARILGINQNGSEPTPLPLEGEPE